ncbi:MAG TPA: IclR family transcriptional regulator [Mycobacteriales bacterium]|nr:IclR family transcriptional regulator [Mycobacteriales bacterium]
MTQRSSVGVLDKAVGVLDCLRPGPASLADLVTRSGLSRATAYRLAVALEVHGLVERDADGRFRLGPHLYDLVAAGRVDPLLRAAEDVLERLSASTHESAQLYRRIGDLRRCVAAAERASGLRDTVPVGADLPMTAGSAAQVLLAWESAGDVASVAAHAKFSSAGLAAVRRRGWAASVGEREAGVASVSAPVFDAHGKVVAAVSVSGPIDRLSRTPGKLHAESVVAAARELTTAVATNPR